MDPESGARYHVNEATGKTIWAGEVVFISGATGYLRGINGAYDRSSDTCGDYSAHTYTKRHDPDISIKHIHAQWQLSHKEKERDVCDAYVEGGYALEECASRIWNSRILDGKVPRNKSTLDKVTMFAGAAALQLVGTPSPPPPTPPLPPTPSHPPLGACYLLVVTRFAFVAGQ